MHEVIKKQMLEVVTKMRETLRDECPGIKPKSRGVEKTEAGGDENRMPEAVARKYARHLKMNAEALKTKARGDHKRMPEAIKKEMPEAIDNACRGLKKRTPEAIKNECPKRLKKQRPRR